MPGRRTMEVFEIEDSRRPSLRPPLWRTSSGQIALVTALLLLMVVYLYGFGDEQESEPDSRDCAALREDVAASFPCLHRRLKKLPYLEFAPKNSQYAMDTAAKDRKRQAEIEMFAAETRPLMHAKARTVIESFLKYKRKHGYYAERKLYAAMDLDSFVTRLLSRRPLARYTDADKCLLLTGDMGFRLFEETGTDMERDPATLEAYLSDDETQVAALLGISSPTHFINNCRRLNAGVPGVKGAFEPKGIFVGQVGCQFTYDGVMDWQHLVVTEAQNVPEWGYGPRSDRNENSLQDVWAEFYDMTHLPTRAEVDRQISQGEESRWVRVRHYGLFDTHMYSKRCQFIAEMFFDECSARGGDPAFGARGSYCQVIGLGLGSWRIHDDQEQIMLAAYKKVLVNMPLPHVVVVDFSYFDREKFASFMGPIAGFSMTGAAGNHIRVRWSQRDPAAKLAKVDENLLLVAQYAWTSGAYPGNEWWNDLPTFSDSSAAASCSLVPWLQNPEINPYGLSGKRVRSVTPPEGVATVPVLVSDGVTPSWCGLCSDAENVLTHRKFYKACASHYSHKSVPLGSAHARMCLRDCKCTFPTWCKACNGDSFYDGCSAHYDMTVLNGTFAASWCRVQCWCTPPSWCKPCMHDDDSIYDACASFYNLTDPVVPGTDTATWCLNQCHRF